VICLGPFVAKTVAKTDAYLNAKFFLYKSRARVAGIIAKF
jgi:hypothetical protein